MVTAGSGYNRFGLRPSVLSIHLLFYPVYFHLSFLFLGVGEKGYQTVELRLVGPILSVAGVLLVCCRVILCFVVIL